MTKPVVSNLVDRQTTSWEEIPLPTIQEEADYICHSKSKTQDCRYTNYGFDKATTIGKKSHFLLITCPGGEPP